MRGNAKHIPSVPTQPCPPDNTSEHVMRQVARWTKSTAINDPELACCGRDAADCDCETPVEYGLLIHPESAMEIASWWQSPGRDRMPFTTFASHGEITDGLAEAIEREISTVQNRLSGAYAEAPDKDALAALRALLAYVKACEVG